MGKKNNNQEYLREICYTAAFSLSWELVNEKGEEQPEYGNGRIYVESNVDLMRGRTGAKKPLSKKER